MYRTKIAVGRFASVFALACALLGVIFAGTAAAQVVESASITNSYSYRVGSQQGSNADAPGDVRLYVSDSTDGFQSDLGLELTASLNDGSFSFLHNGYCVGSCSLTIDTDITFTLINMGTTPVDLRFDSLITPGHLASSNFFGTSRTQGGRFLFSVTQDATQLYTALGVHVTEPPLVATSDNVPFSNLVRDDNSPSWNVLDWSATNLNVDLLTIGAGQTSTLVYQSQLNITTRDASCLDTTLCLGYQVAFGDPRSRGDPTLLSASAFAADFAALATPTFPAVGALYDPYTVTYSFVPVNSPFPSMPPLIPPLPYDIPYGAIDAIPEPATWAMMLLGFAAVGGAARRHRAIPVQARTSV